MSRRSRRTTRARVASGFLAALTAVALISWVSAVVAEEPSREDELEKIRGEIATLQAQLEQLKLKESGIEGELDRIGVELALQERRVAEAETAKKIADDKVAASEAEITRLEARVAAAKLELEARIAGLYRLGRHGYLRLFLSLRPGEEFLPAMRWLRFLARHDAHLVDEYESAKAAVALEHVELSRARGEVEAWFEQMKSRRDRLSELRERESGLLAGTRRRGAQLASQALELADRERKLASFLDALYGRSPGGMTGRPIAEFKGILEWPVDRSRSRVTGEFGPRLDPRYGTRVPHNGIDFATPPGSEVRAIYPGKVLFAAPFEGFGPTVVLEHPGRVLSLYAGLADVAVAADGVVSLHAVVGHAGAALYFEIRLANRPENPRSWLR